MAHHRCHPMGRHKGEALTVGRSKEQNTIIMQTIMEEILGMVIVVSCMQGVLATHSLEAQEEPRLTLS